MEQLFKRMKDRPSMERPYEKCLEYGVDSLTDGELLAVLLRNGTKENSSIEIAWRLLDLHPVYKGLEGLFHLGMEDFKNVKGVGKVKAIQMVCMMELSKRLSRTGFTETFAFQSPEDIASYFMETMRHLDHEEVHLLLLNGKHCLLKKMVLTTGDANTAYVPVKNIFQEALRCGAVHLILVHNHPSGCPEPSREDLMITKRIEEAGSLLGISLSDHVIIGDRCYYSMKEENVL